MRRVFRLGVRRLLGREVDDELAFHLAMREEKLVARGMSADAARAESLRKFGDVGAVRDDCLTFDQEREHAMRRSNLFTEMLRDVAFAGRTLRRNAVFTAVVVGTLAVGIGANTAIFTLVDAVLLRRLPVANPRELVAIGDTRRTNSMSTGSPRGSLFSYALYNDVKGRLQSFTGILASGRSDRLSIRIDSASAAEPVRTRFVSGNYFAVLGVRSSAGRVFGKDEEQGIGSLPAVVISQSFWERRFNADRSVVGRRIRINDVALTIVGVAQPGFQGEIVGQIYDMWVPLSMVPVLRPAEQMLTDRGTSWLLLLGRLAPGVTLERARLETVNVAHDFLAASPMDGATPELLRQLDVPVADGSRGFSRVRADYQGPLITLLAGVGLLLLIICSNVANLLLARGIARSREIGVRLAIGAGRGRLIRQLLTESFVLGLVSAAAGLVVAWWGSKLLLLLAADGSTVIPVDVRLDLPVLAFTLLISMMAVGLFGLAPAVRASRVDLATAMRASAPSLTSSGAGRGLRMPLGRIAIAAQVALSVVLLVAAGMLVRSLRGLESTDVGLDRDHLVVVGVDAAGAGYHGPRLASFIRDLSAAVSAIPGVTAVTYSQNGIFSGSENQSTIKVPGFTARVPADTTIFYDDVGPGYFQSIGAQLRGRDFGVADATGKAFVGVVNDRMARFYWNGDAIGKTVQFNDSVSIRIVGVVHAITDHVLGADTMPRLYVSYGQAPDGEPDALRFELRTAGDPRLLAAAVRKALKSVDASVGVGAPEALQDAMRESIAEQRLVARLASGFGLLAVLLAGIGLYGVMSYAVTRRTGEIGLRVALGAERGNLIAMILGDASRVVGIGLLIGIPAALGATRLLGSQLHGIGAADPVALGASLAVLAFCALIAALVPAIRAARVPPIRALRQE